MQDSHRRSQSRSLQGIFQDLVMRDMGIESQEILLVFGIVHGFFIILASKRLDRVPRIPKSDEQELDFVVVNAAQHTNSAVALSFLVLGQARLMEVIVISIFVHQSRYSTPYACDHSLFLSAFTLSVCTRN